MLFAWQSTFAYGLEGGFEYYERSANGHGKKEIGARALERIASALDMNLSQFFEKV
jgi:hypothetical protein